MNGFGRDKSQVFDEKTGKYIQEEHGPDLLDDILEASPEFKGMSREELSEMLEKALSHKVSKGGDKHNHFKHRVDVDETSVNPATGRALTDLLRQ